MDVSAQVNVGASIGAAVEGTIIPPKVDDFALIASTLFISRHPKRLSLSSTPTSLAQLT
jgi:hypothetical protein